MSTTHNTNGSSNEIKPKPAPALNLPEGNTSVRVRAIDTTTRIVVDAKAFVRPVIPGHEKINLKTLCFLIENEAKNKRIMFDCGSRKDFWNGCPLTVQSINSYVPCLEVDKGVDEILVEAEIPLDSLDAIVWSHWHWDHIGDGSKYPAKTDLVVGPGFKKNFSPGWPEDPNGLVLTSDIKGHLLDEINFDSGLRIGDFNAHDYFGDGSFYILDVPGHTVGHICGFARTTPTTFAFLGGDCCHYPGNFRPTEYVPLPSSIPNAQLDSFFPSPCPCSMFTQYHPRHENTEASSTDDPARSSPFYKVTQEKISAYTFAEEAQRSMDTLQLFDADPNVLICLAHDGALFDVLPLLNNDPTQDISNWKERGYKDQARWGFLNELPKDGKPGRKQLVQGLRRNGKLITMKGDFTFSEVDEG